MAQKKKTFIDFAEGLPVEYDDPNAQPALPAPGADLDYNNRANEYFRKAAELEAQAAVPTPKPKGFKENLISGLRAFAEGMSRPQDPYYMQRERAAEDAAAKKDLIERARQATSTGQQEQQMGETALLRQVQQSREKREAQNQEFEQSLKNRPVPYGSGAAGSQYGHIEPTTGEHTVEGTVPVRPTAADNKDIKVRDYTRATDHKPVSLYLKRGADPEDTASYYEVEAFSPSYVAPPGGGASQGQPGSPDVVKYFAGEIARDANNWTLVSGNKTLSDQVRAELAHPSSAAAPAPLSKMTMTTRQLGETASSILPHIDEITAKLQQPEIAAKLGPIQGRWNEFLAGKIGSGDPDLVELRTAIGLLQTGAMRAHVGARGGQGLMDKFVGLMNSGQMDAPTLIASLKGLRPYMQGYAEKVYGPSAGQHAAPAAAAPRPNIDLSQWKVRTTK